MSPIRSLAAIVLMWSLTCMVQAGGPQPPDSARRLQLQPTADAGADRVVVVGEQVLLHGSASSPDNEILQLRWDLDGDGVDDVATTAGTAVSHRFTTPGEYRAVLTVRDAAGREARDSCRIVVVATALDEATRDTLLQVTRQRLASPADGHEERFAILLNGASEERFWTDVELAHAMLTSGYAVPAGNIHLLNDDGTDPWGANPGGMITGPATMAEVAAAFDDVATRADGDDLVLLWITDHGRGYYGPLSQGGDFEGLMDGRASVDPGDEPDFPESAFPLRCLFTGGDFRTNHGLDAWIMRRETAADGRVNFYRNMYVSSFTDLYVEDLAATVSDGDERIELLTDLALGDTNRDRYIDESIGEVFDFDGDGVPPYDPATGAYDEDDWGAVDQLYDNYNLLATLVPDGAKPYLLFDPGLAGRVCVDLGYAGGTPEADGCDDDNQGLFDWLDVNQDGDTDDVVSVDEAVSLYLDTLYDDDLALLLDTLAVGTIVVVAEPCFSGGLVEDLSGTRRVLATASIEDAVSWGNVFIRAWVAALHGEDESGTPVDADADGDGRVSMLEAFNQAAASDTADEDPQYDDSGDGVSQSAPVPAGGDGALGGRTFLDGLGPPPMLFTDDFETTDTSRWSRTVG